MNMHWIDWTIVCLLLSGLILITIFARGYTRSVADFLAANRLAGRYVLTVASGFTGAIGIIAVWEMVYNAGLPTQWWTMMSIPVGLFIVLTGFVIYRFRQTRALTLAQFFEMRYSRRFRFFAGGLCWLSGILNYGIFPAVTARFIIFFFGLPESYSVFGLSVSMFPTVMLIYLSIALFIACVGGQISIMLTDFFQGMLTMIIFMTLMFYLLHLFSWNDIVAGLQTAPPDQSMLNPFKTSQVSDFNIWFFLIGIFGSVLTTRSWQGSSGYNSAARTPHEAVMAGIIGGWRTIASSLCILLIPLAAYAVLHLPAFSNLAAPINAEIAKISDPMIRSQMTVPLFISHILPVGMMGAFAAIIVASAISCDDTYLHSWGSIFVQDVYMPLRNKPIDPNQHIWLLRFSICGVAVFGFIFSMLFPLKDFILMYFALTGAIYGGGVGPVLIGGLYWKRGTPAAAWTSMSVGSTLAFGGLLVQQLWAPWMVPLLLKTWPDLEWVVEHKDKFPINGQIICFIAMTTSLSCYVLISLFGPRCIHNMDKLLHRGAYAVKEDASEPANALAMTSRFTFSKLIGISKDFSRFDRFIAWATFGKSMIFWFVFLIVTVLSLATGWITDNVWQKYWWWYLVVIPAILGTVCTIWISAGGIRDAVRLFKDLRAERVDESDDGFVKDGDPIFKPKKKTSSLRADDDNV